MFGADRGVPRASVNLKGHDYVQMGLQVDFNFPFMTYFRHLPDQPVAIQKPKLWASQLDLKGLDQYAADRYMALVSRIVVVPWTWKGTRLCLFAIVATGRRASNERIGIYLVEDGKIIARRLSADECSEFHDLMELNENAEALSPAFTVG
jgi:hypothetical protein